MLFRIGLLVVLAGCTGDESEVPTSTATDPRRQQRRMALLLAPTAVFSILFNAFDISSVWIRVFGVLCLTFSAYYVGTPFFESRGAPSGFYRSTVFGRTFVFVSLCAVALLERHAQRGLIILAVINAASAFTMHLALRRAE